MSDISFSYQGDQGGAPASAAGNDGNPTEGLHVTHGIVALFFLALFAYMAFAYGVFRRINNAL